MSKRSSEGFSALAGRPHRRYNPLTREWILVSPHRTQRPWQGQVEKHATPAAAAYDPQCYLCPGNARSGGARNPAYEGTYVFDNDFSALLPGAAPARFEAEKLLIAEAEPGVCRVLCFSPRHDLTLSKMSESELLAVVELWAAQYRELGDRPEIGYVQIFENRGAMMGASNAHPHGQVWASASLPNEPAKEQAALLERRAKGGDCLLCAYARHEESAGERLVCANENFLAVVPFWAVWPFETLLLPRRHKTGLDALEEREKKDLASILKDLTSLYDSVFEVPFPYSMGFHQRPTDGEKHDEWHLHAHFYPPLLRSATVRKFMVGYEMLASPQRDITPEQAAARLRECRHGG